MTEHTPKAVVLLSGGIDSAVCLQQALDEYEKVEAIHIDYGQQTESIERSNAEAQATAHNIDLHTVDYRTVFAEFAEGTIEDKEYDSNHMAEEGHSVGYVPQRNLHFLTSAAAVAEHHTDPGVELVLFHGAQYNDSTDYPDCRPAFIEAAQKAINRSTDQHTVTIETPLIDLDKPEVLTLGEKLGVDWSLTFSCYNDQSGTPCGECPACVERKEAFEKADIEDPVVAQ
ncbi:7-cyano-7-deazaguanine synthase [Salinarchaeum sp. IM2453]|uniref:7-cyano-7-deazaguanine synthase n=1 Tax=Salinarchaeum sp. IM2453 TaxID=2862870 RepID=UPI001C8375D6|nr:7-cyano-7-deazaguanine synthase [Salinarchaeum sp. IM2453]QZA87755.1 7-cyano-7-deazaguanine synthase [Salinarchaeum sp. IM2453]